MKEIKTISEFIGKYPFLRNRLKAIDIELERIGGYITVFGSSKIENNEPEYLSLIANYNLSKKSIKQNISKTYGLLSFNGTYHDIPILKKQYGKLFPSKAYHLDLYRMSGLLGYKCSLKDLESEFGIKRAGFKKNCATQLWHEYQKTGHEKYLNALVRYNYYDTVNLHKIADKLYDNTCRKYLWGI